MTTEQAYENGLRKLEMTANNGEPIGKTCRIRQFSAYRQCSCGFRRDAYGFEPHVVPIPDPRTDSAFAWRVLEALRRQDVNTAHCCLDDEDMSASLYAAVVALGKEE